MSQTLTGRCRHFFQPAAIARGQSYAASGQVGPLQKASGGVTTRVRGQAGSYRVALQWDETSGGFAFSCSCPHFADGVNCKHLWAFLLKLDAEGLSANYADDSEIQPAVRKEQEREREPAPVQAPKWHGSLYHRRQNWQTVLEQIGSAAIPENTPTQRRPRRAFFRLDIDDSAHQCALCCEVWSQEIKKDGSLGKPKQSPITSDDLVCYPDERDREILGLLLSSIRTTIVFYGSQTSLTSRPITLSGSLAEILLPKLVATGRFFASPEKTVPPQFQPLTLAEGEPLRCQLELREEGRDYLLGARLVGNGMAFAAEQADVVTNDWTICENRIYRMRSEADARWAMSTEAVPPIARAQGPAFVAKLFTLPQVPETLLPDSLAVERRQVDPHWLVRFESADTSRFSLQLLFSYGDQEVSATHAGAWLYDSKHRQLIERRPQWEADLHRKLSGLEQVRETSSGQLSLARADFVKVAETLLKWGWDVRVQSARLRAPSDFSVAVSSGIDWFELRGKVTFGAQNLSLPELLANREAHEHWTVLGDGTLGLLPEAWLSKFAPLAGLGETADDAIRFERSQGLLLDAWLQQRGETVVCAGLSELRERVARLSSLEPAKPVAAFRGSLRPYQEVGLGWLQRLAQSGFGGVLADDMGLGKTVQCLAFLLTRKRGRPSLVVAPKTLLFNWREEAARFAPDLKVLEYSGTHRRKLLSEFDDYDLILTNYPIVRLDIADLKDARFDCVILDEAQSIKNADAQTAKACRLLQGEFRLAMTGTPIENSVTDLFSLFDFVSPGLLGGSARRQFRAATTGAVAANDVAEPFSRALNPFILRRTKKLVAQDLPERSEQDLYVELTPQEMTEYRELRDFYRTKLLDKGETKRNKIYVLEALLRLRQLACHPGLIDEKRKRELSGKLALLVEQLTEVTREGHKVLVFSQFTQFLRIVQTELEARGLPLEYLDGRTQDRQERVERFQKTAQATVFLISLKAGGLGLNLTSADYVYILDPWWNPAVEAQAIDRTHRIGQLKRVMAYRLIAKDTVEEKVLELQRRKKGLAEALISADRSLLQKLTDEDLDLLLS